MIATEADIARGLEALLELDPRLTKVVEIAGEVPLRRSTPGLVGLVATVIGQQVSTASARAILGRFAALVDLRDPRAILAADDATFRAAGLSRGKERTVIAIAEAVRDGRLDLARIDGAAPAEAVGELKSLHGIGVWTAECYLLFAAGHPDIFPAGDLALQVAVGHAFDLAGRPKEKAVAEMAEAWSPHRSVAARLFWKYYHEVTRRDAAPAEIAADRTRLAAEAALPKKADEASQRRHDRTP
ncbi:DNA-3-methyladenine glycosidase [Aureimonas endophytica]|uniref:DNA-3-methyladenine glycosylase II n=1 Tax=Aureimonas endophytica TaxID=2027858 RepID=A0A916ZTZ9_9HYPH|nr:DNA-3-methyladenine glycosylase [Aureimonas endophytica]GGE14005.1 DNA-3-methyladenine glycosidase [Aureimonas endophytica]